MNKCFTSVTYVYKQIEKLKSRNRTLGATETLREEKAAVPKE